MPIKDNSYNTAGNGSLIILYSELLINNAELCDILLDKIVV